jgi:hypothetical protein
LEIKNNVTPFEITKTNNNLFLLSTIAILVMVLIYNGYSYNTIIENLNQQNIEMLNETKIFLESSLNYTNKLDNFYDKLNNVLNK